MHPVMDAKVILDAFASCEHYGYNYDPAIMSYVSKSVKQLIATIIEYRKKIQEQGYNLQNLNGKNLFLESRN